MIWIAMNERSSKRYDAAFVPSRNDGRAEAPRGSACSFRELRDSWAGVLRAEKCRKLSKKQARPLLFSHLFRLFRV